VQTAECCNTVGHWFSAIWAHHTDSALVALVTRQSASHVQVGNACPQVLERTDLDTPHAMPERSFAVAGQNIWNSLPPAIWDPSLSSQGFKRLLKTYCLDNDCSASAFELAPEKCTYLLIYCTHILLCFALLTYTRCTADNHRPVYAKWRPRDTRHYGMVWYSRV